MKKSAKILALVLSVVLVVTLLAACGGEKEGTKPAKTETTQAVPPPQAQKQEEPVKISYKTYHAAKSGHENYSETTIGKIIKEKLNIIVDVLPMKADNAAQDIITDIAAGKPGRHYHRLGVAGQSRAG